MNKNDKDRLICVFEVLGGNFQIRDINVDGQTYTSARTENNFLVIEDLFGNGLRFNLDTVLDYEFDSSGLTLSFDDESIWRLNFA